MKVTLNKVMLTMLAASMLSLPVQAFADSVKLFDASAPVFTGDVTDATSAIPTNQKELVLNCPTDIQVSATLSSTPDGIGGIVVDNFITVNDTNVCVGGSSTTGNMGTASNNCFVSYNGPSDFTVANIPISDYTPVPVLNISNFIPTGRHLVTFATLDYGDLSANSDIWLVTNCKIDQKVQICHKPGTPAQQIITVDQSAVKGQLSHGDSLILDGCTKK